MSIGGNLAPCQTDRALPTPHNFCRTDRARSHSAESRGDSTGFSSTILAASFSLTDLSSKRRSNNIYPHACSGHTKTCPAHLASLSPVDSRAACEVKCNGNHRTDSGCNFRPSNKSVQSFSPLSKQSNHPKSPPPPNKNLDANTAVTSGQVDAIANSNTSNHLFENSASSANPINVPPLAQAVVAALKHQQLYRTEPVSDSVIPTATSSASSSRFSPSYGSDDDDDDDNEGHPNRDSDSEHQQANFSDGHSQSGGAFFTKDTSVDLIEVDAESGYGASCSSSSTRLCSATKKDKRRCRRRIQRRQSSADSKNSPRPASSGQSREAPLVDEHLSGHGRLTNGGIIRHKRNRVRIVDDFSNPVVLKDVQSRGRPLMSSAELSLGMTAGFFSPPTSVDLESQELRRATRRINHHRFSFDGVSLDPKIFSQHTVPSALLSGARTAIPPPASAVPGASILVSASHHQSRHYAGIVSNDRPISFVTAKEHQPTTDKIAPFDKSIPSDSIAVPTSSPTPVYASIITGDTNHLTNASTVESPVIDLDFPSSSTQPSPGSRRLSRVPRGVSCPYHESGISGDALPSCTLCNQQHTWSCHPHDTRNRYPRPSDATCSYSAEPTETFDLEGGRRFGETRCHSHAGSPPSHPIHKPSASGVGSSGRASGLARSLSAMEQRRYSAPIPHYEINLASPVDTASRSSTGDIGRSNRVSLVVDNVRFVIDADRLQAHPDTMLGRMLGSKLVDDAHMLSDSTCPGAMDSDDDCSASTTTTTWNNGRYSRRPSDIILAQDSNISAQLFRAILDYYLVGHMICPPGVPVQELKEACDYFLIPFNHHTVRCSNLRAFLHELSNDGAHVMFERFLEEHILPLLVKCAQLGERECHVVIVTDDETIDWDPEYPPQMPENELHSNIIHSTQMFRFLKYIENRDVAKLVLSERGLKKIRIGIEGYPTSKDRVKYRLGMRPEAIYNYVQCPFLRMSWEEEENKSRHVDFQCVKSKSVSDLTTGLEQAVVDPLPPHLARSPLGPLRLSPPHEPAIQSTSFASQVDTVETDGTVMLEGTSAESPVVAPVDNLSPLQAPQSDMSESDLNVDSSSRPRDQHHTDPVL